MRLVEESTTLPLEARELLKMAAATPDTDRNPWAKEDAINRAIAKIRREYPAYFKPDCVDYGR